MKYAVALMLILICSCSSEDSKQLSEVTGYFVTNIKTYSNDTLNYSNDFQYDSDNNRLILTRNGATSGTGTPGVVYENISSVEYHNLNEYGQLVSFEVDYDLNVNIGFNNSYIYDEKNRIKEFHSYSEFSGKVGYSEYYRWHKDNYLEYTQVDKSSDGVIDVTYFYDHSVEGRILVKEQNDSEGEFVLVKTAYHSSRGLVEKVISEEYAGGYTSKTEFIYDDNDNISTKTTIVTDENGEQDSKYVEIYTYQKSAVPIYDYYRLNNIEYY